MLPKNTLRTVAFGALSLIMLRGNSCGPDVLENASFDLWCGESLCDWTVDGDVERVPTWHEKDYGISLVGDPVTLSQLGVLGSDPPECFQFDLLVQKDDDAELSLVMDFEDDGTDEYKQPIPAGDWSPVQFAIKPPTSYSAVRFKVEKKGSGGAVLARIRIRAGGKCLGDPIELNDRPLGASCETDGQCASTRCVEITHPFENYFETGSVCSACGGNSDCSDDEVCGAQVDDEVGVRLECVPRGQRVVGERCSDEGECASGVCCEGVCSECCDGAGCEGGATCERRDWEPLGMSHQVLALPHQCAPGGGGRQAGAACLFDDDCASGTCRGEESLCLCAFDGWRCESRQCLPVCFGDEDGACNDRQLGLGASGGVCD